MTPPAFPFLSAMNRFPLNQAFRCGLTVLALLLAGRLQADESRRLFDFAPVSKDNPVVATIDGMIVVPLSELRGYRDAERPKAIIDPASLAQKRAVLDDLINEYLFVDDAYRTGVVQSEGFQRRMDATRTMVLSDFMAARAGGEKSKPAANAPIPGAELAERLFEKESIEVSNEAYALLRSAVRAADAARAPPTFGPIEESAQEASARLRAVINATPEAVLVRYADRSISVHQILVIYAGLPGARPPLDTPAGLTQMIKPLILPELMAIEAVKRGVAAEPEFQHKLIQNQNALLRFHMQDLIGREANALLHAPGAEARLHAWYEAHKTEYAATGADGKKRIPSYEQARPRVEGDCSVALRDRLLAEKAAALRGTHTVLIDEAVLGRL